MAKITSILFVEAVEPALEFWVDRMGFVKTTEVPDGDRLGFAIVEQGDAELMLQSWRSVEADAGANAHVGDPRAYKSVLFIEVPDFAAIERRLAGYPVAMPVRDAFYGMREIGVIVPGGHMAVFASPITK